MKDKPENWNKGFDHPWKIGCGGHETPFISNNKCGCICGTVLKRIIIIIVMMMTCSQKNWSIK